MRISISDCILDMLSCFQEGLSEDIINSPQILPLETSEMYEDRIIIKFYL